MPETSEITVLIAAFNACDTIERAVRSVAQDSLVGEIVVVDDGSTDDTVGVLQNKFPIKKLKIYSTGKNLGPSAARNLGLQKIMSPWIAILDSDDYFLEGRLEKMYANINGVDIIADELFYCLSDINEILPRKMLGRYGLIDLEFFIRNNISSKKRRRTELGFLKPLISRDFLCRKNISYRNNLRLGEDFAFYTDALMAGARFKTISACGYVSVERRKSLSAQHDLSDLEHLCEFDEVTLMRDLNPAERDALCEHWYDLKNRLRLRRFLYAKSMGDYEKMAYDFFDSLNGATYIFREILKAKLRTRTSGQ